MESNTKIEKNQRRKNFAKKTIRTAGKLSIAAGKKAAVAAGQAYKWVNEAEQRENERLEQEKVERQKELKEENNKRWQENLRQRKQTVESANKSGFDVLAYAEKRKHTNPWVTIEIGPGIRPSGLNRKFTGKSAYIGLEAKTNLDREYGAHTEEYFAKLKAARPEENIFHRTDEKIGRTINARSVLGRRIIMAESPEALDPEAKKALSDYSNYTIPDNSADEVFTVFTIDDPSSNEGLIIAEAERLLKPGGVFIVYDTDNNLDRVTELLQYSELTPMHISTTPEGEHRWEYKEHLYEDLASKLGCYQADSSPEMTARNRGVSPDTLIIAVKPETT